MTEALPWLAGLAAGTGLALLFGRWIMNRRQDETLRALAARHAADPARLNPKSSAIVALTRTSRPGGTGAGSSDTLASPKVGARGTE